jgi:hypothetical protein
VRELFYLFKAFSDLALWVKALIYFLLATTVIGATALIFDRKAALIAAFGIFILTLILLLYLLVIFLVRRHQSAVMRGEIASLSAHRGIVDPGARGRLEDLHRVFVQGLEKFALAGKDLYRMPWFLIVGEPGSGKSEAIRRSGVGFPPGMQDEYQGVGGTVNMNWWFTNHAILLDIAGRLIFEEVEPGVTSEWRAFLGLLRKHRFHCPINGLLLTISIESLIHDTPEVMEQKAVRIAQQLEVIRRELDIRFPVFILLTKADRITGFREFFENIQDAKGQQQMLGWSNPASLDAPFRPELVDEHLREVSERLEQRRFALLGDFSTAGTVSRRIDDIDRLFQFPTNLRSLAPRLRRYLETIFVAGEWSSRPLFLRGIYFTSAMREGAELDEEVAAALGVKLDSVIISDDRVWEHDRSYFLRDVFLDKVFREDGLVTRAANANRLLFRRHVLIFGCGILGLVALICFGLLGYQSFQRTIFQETLLWARASTDWRKEGWNPIIIPDPSGTAQWKYEGNEPVKAFTNPGLGLAQKSKPISLLEFHEILRDTCSENLAVPWVFSPFAHLGSDLNQERQRAQKTVFDASVIRPVFAAAFAKMSESQPDFPKSGKADPRPASAIVRLEELSLLALVRLEIEKLKPGAFSAEEGPGKTYLVPLLEYVSGEKNNDALEDIATWTYARNGGFPPAWIADDPGAAQAIREGLSRAAHRAEEALSERDTKFHLLLDLAGAVRDYQNLETDLSLKANIKNDPATSDSEVAAAFDRLREAKVLLEAKLATVQQAKLFDGNDQQLSSAYQSLASAGEEQIAVIRSLNTDLEKAVPNGQPSPTASPSASVPLDYRVQNLQKIDQELKNWNKLDPRYGLLREIKSRVAPLSEEIRTRVDAGISPQQLEEFKKLDAAFLEPNDKGEPVYLERWDLYQQARSASPSVSKFSDQSNLVGQNMVPLKEEVERIESLRARIDSYNAPFREPFLNTTNYLLGRAEDTQREGFSTAYVQEIKAKLSQRLKFPLVWPPAADGDSMTVGEIVQLRGLLTAYRSDVQSPAFQKLDPTSRAELTEFSKSLNRILGICDFLVREDGNPRQFSVTLLNGQAQRQLSGPDFAPAPTPFPTPTPRPRSFLSRMFVHPKVVATPTPTPYFNPRNWNSVELLTGSMSKPGLKSSGIVPLDSASDSALGQLQLDAPFRFRLFHKPSGGSSEFVEGGEDWSVLRILSRFGGKPLDTGQYWRVSLKPGEPTAVWIQVYFDRPMPDFETWPTLDSVGLRDFSR